MKTTFKIFEVVKESNETVWDQPFTLAEPAGYLAGLRFETREEALSDIQSKGYLGFEYVILEIISKE